MSVSADTLALLMASGVTGDALIAVVRSIETDNGPSHSSGAERQRRYRARQREEGDVTGDVTPLHNGGDVSTPILDKESVPQTPFKEINPTPDTQTRPRKADPFLCPEGVEAEHWRDFLANRKAKRLPNTDTAFTGQMRKLAELTDDEWPPGRIVQFCVEKGWGSINDPRESEHRNGHGRLAQRAAETSGIGPTQAAANIVKARLREARELAPGWSGSSG